MYSLIFLIFLAVSIFLFFYFVLGGSVPDVEVKTIKEMLLHYGVSLLVASIFFLITSKLFLTPLAGLAWAVLGWFVPIWIKNEIARQKKMKARKIAKDFCKTAASLYQANQTTYEVVKTFASRAPEPFGSEFQNMLNQRQFNEYFSFSKEFKKLGEKYNLPEFEAASAVLEAERNAGYKAAARGFQRLGRALDQNDKLALEREKSTYEPKLAAYIVIILLMAGVLADATVWRDLYSSGGGRVAMALASILIVAMVLVVNKITAPQDYL